DELVIHREGDGFALRPIAESGIESEDFHMSTSSGLIAPLRSRLRSAVREPLPAYPTGTPTSFFFLRNVIISRSSRPTVSMGWVCAAARMARNFLRPVLFSSIHCRANSPDWISERIFHISARVCWLTTRGPRV